MVIDNGDDFRMDDRVPLVVPEINPEALREPPGLRRQPNCSTIIALMALGPLHRAAGLRRVVACTYQAVSGSGSAAVSELEQQARAWAKGEAAVCRGLSPSHCLQRPCPDRRGEGRQRRHQRRAEDAARDPQDPRGRLAIRSSSTCVRVPVFNSHSEALHLELKRPLTSGARRARSWPQPKG